MTDTHNERKPAPDWLVRQHAQRIGALLKALYIDMERRALCGSRESMRTAGRMVMHWPRRR